MRNHAGTAAAEPLRELTDALSAMFAQHGGPDRWANRGHPSEADARRAVVRAHAEGPAALSRVPAGAEVPEEAVTAGTRRADWTAVTDECYCGTGEGETFVDPATNPCVPCREFVRAILAAAAPHMTP